MTFSETAELLARLKACYSNIPIDAGNVAEYHHHLQRYDYPTVQAASDQHVLTSRYFPSIAELVDGTRAIRRQTKPIVNDLPTPSETVPPEKARTLIQRTLRSLGRVDDTTDEASIVRQRERLTETEWVEAGVRSYDAWRGDPEKGSSTFAEAKVREHYPLHADAILAEAKTILEKQRAARGELKKLRRVPS